MDHHAHAHHMPEHATHSDQAAPATSLNRLAFSATLHCLSGCAVGEVLGMVIGTALGWSIGNRGQITDFANTPPV